MPTGKHLSEADRHFGWLATDVARLMRTIFDRRVKALGITRPQWLALSRLKRKPGASQSELADMMEIERAPTGKIVDRLQERGWLERRPDPGDRRINRIFLTEQGEKVHAAIWPIGQATVNDALSDLLPREVADLTELLARVKARLAEIAEGDSMTDIEWPDEVVINGREELAEERAM
jgi:MarR family transcriptional regulator for hemolysin